MRIQIVKSCSVERGLVYYVSVPSIVLDYVIK